MCRRVLHSIVTFFTLFISIKIINSQDTCTSKVLNNIFYKITTKNADLVGNTYVFNGVPYKFPNDDEVTSNLSTPKGNIFEYNGDLYYDRFSGGRHKIKTHGRIDKYNLKLSNEHIVFILPISSNRSKAKKLYTFDTLDFKSNKRGIITDTAALLTCSIKSITTDNTTNNLLLYGEQGGQNVFVLFEKFDYDPCAPLIKESFNEKLTTLQNYTTFAFSNLFSNTQRKCNHRNSYQRHRGDSNSGFLTNFKVMSRDLRYAYQNDISEATSKCTTNCLSNQNSEVTNNELNAEIYKLNEKLKFIHGELNKFKQHIAQVVKPCQKLSFKTYEDIFKNKRTMIIHNEPHDCVPVKQQDEFNKDYNLLKRDYNDIIESLTAYGSELDNFISENKPSEIIVN